MPPIGIILLLTHFLPLVQAECSSNHFILPGMQTCHPLLSCESVAHFKPIKPIAKGVVKNVWLAEWNHHPIVLSTLTNTVYVQDFQSNLRNLKFFQSSNLVINLIGSCGNTLFVEYHRHGSAVNLSTIFKTYRIESFKNRFDYCISYVEIIKFLHENFLVMCDSNTLWKALSQYLITDQLKLIVNDLDALESFANGRKFKCGHRRVFGDLVAPEQLWPFPHKPFDNSQLPPYNEKIDIWKIPEICEWIVKDSNDIPLLARRFLTWIHSKCKSLEPQHRPSATDIFNYYTILTRYFL